MENPSSFAEFAAAVRAARPEVALVLGSGMGSVVRRVEPIQTIPFGAIPGMAATTVAGHSGRLTFGRWAERRVLLFEGRLHYYEGHPWDKVIVPVQTAAALGAKVLLLTNAAGGIHAALGPGNLMIVNDHIEWTRPYCWRLPGPGGIGPVRPSPYSRRLVDLLARASQGMGADLLQGVYAQLTGPCYETPAEIRALRAWGADAVGMSTAREIQTGADAGMECAAISCITNKAAGLSGAPLNHEEVLTTAAAQSKRLAELFERFLTAMPQP